MAAGRSARVLRQSVQSGLLATDVSFVENSTAAHPEPTPALADSEIDDEIDILTGLCSADGMIRRFEQKTWWQPQALMLYLDVDGFSEINERWGWHAGDQVLCEIASRLTTSMRDDDIVSRLEADEFAVVCCAPWSDDAAINAAMRIARELSRPFAIQHMDGSVGSLTVGVSMGTALGGTTDLSALLLHADKNLARAQERRGVTAATGRR